MTSKCNINAYMIAIVCLLSYFELGELRSLVYFNQVILIFSLFAGIWIFFSRGSRSLSRYDFCWFLAIIAFVVIRNRYIENGEFDTNILYYLLLAVFVMSAKNNVKWVHYFIDFMYRISLIHAVATIIFAFSKNLFDLYTSYFLGQEYYIEAMARYEKGTISGLCVNYGANAGIITIGTGIAIVKLIYSDKKDRIKKFFPFLIRLSGLLFTGKRSPVLLLIVAVGFIYVFIEKDKVDKKVFRVAILGIFSVMSLFIGAMFVPQLQVLVGRLLDSDDWTTLGGRTELYDLAIGMFKSNPLLGQGWNSYKLVSENTIGKVYVRQYARMQTHNIYLQLLSEVGLIGFAAIVTLLVMPIFTTFKMTRKNGVQGYLGIECNNCMIEDFLSCIFILIFFLLYGMTGNPLYDPYMYFLGMMSCAALQSYNVKFKRQLRYKEIIDGGY